MHKILLLVLGVFLCGCAQDVTGYYTLDENYLQKRQLETRRFDTLNEEKILIAAAQVLQDLGFTIVESETKLGLITASKDREGTPVAGQVALSVLAGLSGQQAIYDVNQTIYVMLVSTKNPKSKSFNVRVKFARVIQNNMNQTRIEQIEEEGIYKIFFDRLSQSVFLTAHDL